MSPANAALSAFEQKFAKEFGEGRMSRFKKGQKPAEHDVVSTGSAALDHALGVGGLVVGRIVESFGPPQTGKSTMAMLMAVEQQKRFPDKMVGWIDVERTWDDKWAVAHGVDMTRIWVVRPTVAEEVADQVRRFLDSGLCSMVTVDSIGALLAQKELDKDAGEAVVGSVAKIVTRTVRMAAPVAQDQGATLHVINQIRANIGSYGADTTGSGGFALQHATTVQLTFRKTGEPPLTIGTTKDREIVGRTFAVRVSKNKVAPADRTAMITLKNQDTPEHGPIGLDRAAEAFQLADRFSFFDRTGAWYTLSDGSRHNGAEAVRTHLRANPKMIEEIRTRALSAVAHTVIAPEDELKEGGDKR